MSTYVTRYCPSCNYTLENFTRDYRDIGKPFVVCPKCGQIVKYKHIFEWDTKNFFGKLAYMGVLLYTSIFYGIVLPLVYLGFSEISGNETDEGLFIILYIIGFILVGIWLTYKLMQDIKDSRKRLEDPRYKELLKKMGFNIYTD